MSAESDPSSVPQPPPEAADAAYPALEELARERVRGEWHGIKTGFRRIRLISDVRQVGMRGSETLGVARF
jgi:endonuclease YncB( thermonuclease family)